MAATVQTDQTTDLVSYEPENAPNADRRSKLVKARHKNPGQIINPCPFDANKGHLDHRQYCHHLIGFTDPDDGVNPNNPPRYFYPQKRRPELDPKTGLPTGRDSEHVYTDGTDPQLIVKGDYLVLGTTCYRVYRDVPAPPKPHNPRTQARDLTGVAVDNEE